MEAIKVQTDGNHIILIEPTRIELAGTSGQAGGSIAGGKIEERILKLHEIGDVIADVCKTLQHRIHDALKASRPTELTLEFGVTLAGEMGIPFVTKGSAEGTFQVTATWSSSKD